MKKILLILSLLIYSISNAQIVNIPDANFKQALLNYSPTIDTNSDGEIQVSEAQNVLNLDVSNKNIYNLTGIEEFTALTYLNCYYNYLSTLDLSNHPNLTNLYCGDNQLTTLDISNQPNLTGLNCGDNQLTTLDISNQPNLTYLNCSDNQLTTLDISNQPNLTGLNCGDNQLTTLDISNQPDLTELNCGNNQLTTLDLSNQPNLTIFECNGNQITTLDLSNLPNLSIFECIGNQISTLNLSNQPYLYEVFCGDNPNLSYINLKNGNNTNLQTHYSNFMNLPNLQTICVDELNTDLTASIAWQVNHPVTFNEDCSIVFTSGNQILGNVKIDLNDNGCDSSDLPLSNSLITSTNGIDSFATFTQNNGNYLLYTNEGDFITFITSNLPNYFATNPTSQTNTFTGYNNIFTADFCVVPNQTVNDVNISLIPTSQARPGFNTTYQIAYKNVGTTQLNGNVTLEFDETKLSFSNASETISSQTSNSVTFDYSNLNPFETRTIDLEFNVSVPPTTEIDDILNFTTTINPIASDYTTDDNIFVLNQTVIGSYDPNDITCLEGNQVLFAVKDEYLHYIIRFQNTGTASAINVVVKNILDNHLDWSTLQLESLSHNNRVAIKNGNKIEFIFENIDLPDSTTDEPNSHGFIAYKIKPKTDIALDDIILNKADIFFDYNSPIETNTASTRIVNVLAVNENTLLDFSAYPTPTENILNIKSKTEISKIEIYSKLGQLILKNETENNIDISNLTNGLYFVKAEDINGNFGIKKIMKK